MADQREPEAGGHGLRVVLLDPRPARRLLVRHLIESTGLADPDIAEAATAAEAVELVDERACDVAVVEIQMPVARGLEAIAALRARFSALKIVVCSFHRDPATKEQARVEGADAYLDKPVSTLYLKALLRGFLPVPSSAAT